MIIIQYLIQYHLIQNIRIKWCKEGNIRETFALISDPMSNNIQFEFENMDHNTELFKWATAEVCVDVGLSADRGSSDILYHDPLD